MRQDPARQPICDSTRLDLQELEVEVLEVDLDWQHPIVDLVDHRERLADTLVDECLVEEERCLGLANRWSADPSTKPNEP